MPYVIAVALIDGEVPPLTWDDVIGKFSRLSEGIIDQPLQNEIIRVIQHLENGSSETLTKLLAKI